MSNPEEVPLCIYSSVACMWKSFMFYGISTIVGYLMPKTYQQNRMLPCIAMYHKHQSLVYTQLNDQTVLFSKSHLFSLCLNVKQFYLTHR